MKLVSVVLRGDKVSDEVVADRGDGSGDGGGDGGTST